MVLDNSRASAWYRVQSGLAVQSGSVVGSLWDSSVDPDNIAASWAKVAPQATGVTLSQANRAASGASTYVAQTVADAGLIPASVRLNPSSFVSAEITAARMNIPSIRALQRIRAGEPVADAMASGRALATTIAAQTSRDAGRDAVSVAMIADDQVAGWVRYLVRPSCGRCAVLAGRVYEWSDGFLRHPNCDCQHRPVTKLERDGLGMDQRDVPREYFDSLSEAEQNKYFGNEVSEKIRDGGDLQRAVNAERGMWRDTRGRMIGPGDLPRTRINSIMAQTGGNRIEAVRILKEQGSIGYRRRAVQKATTSPRGYQRARGVTELEDAVDFHKRLDIDLDELGKISDESFDVDGDPVLSKIWERQGFDGPPVITSQPISGDGAIYRGIAGYNDTVEGALQWADDFTSSKPPFPGKGMFGNGSYFAEDIKISAAYSGQKGAIVAARISPKARVVQMVDLERAMDDWKKARRAEYRRLEKISLDRADAYDLETDKLRRRIVRDPGRFASAMGYDAIHIRSADYYVVLNRTALEVNKAVATSSLGV